MITAQNLGGMIGAPVIGRDDEKIGTVGQVFVDPGDGNPNWMTVHTGLFGRHESFVPLDQATWDHERVHIDFDRDTVKRAPRVDTGGALSPEDEAGLYRYYNTVTGDEPNATTDETESADASDTPVGRGPGSGGGLGITGVRGESGVSDEVHGQAGATAGVAESGEPAADADTTHDDDSGGSPAGGPTDSGGSTPSADRQGFESGSTRLRRYIVTEEQTVSVPVRREEVRLEGEPAPEGAEVSDAGDEGEPRRPKHRL